MEKGGKAMWDRAIHHALPQGSQEMAAVIAYTGAAITRRAAQEVGVDAHMHPPRPMRGGLLPAIKSMFHGVRLLWMVRG